MGRHTSSGAPVIDLVKVTGSSILEVVFLAAVGYILARRGVIDKKTQTKINKLNVSFFTPALLFSKVAFTLNPRRLVELVIVPLGFVIITAVSALSAIALAAVFRLPKAQRNFAIACAISPNSNSLPVALMQSLVTTVPQLHWEEEGEPEDTVNGMLGRALTYLVLYSTLGMFLRWSVGAQLLSTVDQAEAEREQAERLEGSADADNEDETQHADREEVPLLRGRAQQITPALHVRSSTADGSFTTDIVSSPNRSENSRARPVRKRTGPPAWARSFPNSPTGSRTSFSDDEDEEEAADDEEHAGAPRRSVEDPEWGESGSRAAARQAALANGGGAGSSSSALQSTSRKVRRTCISFVMKPLQAVWNFMTMPLWASLLSLVVALIPPLQNFIDSLDPVVGALETAGACSIPLTMVVLGAYFHEETPSHVHTSPHDEPAKHGQPPAPFVQAATGKGTDQDSRPSAPPQVDDPWRVSSTDSSGTLSSSTAVNGTYGATDASDAIEERRPQSRASWVYNPWASNSVGSVRGSSTASNAPTAPPSSIGSAAALTSDPSAASSRAAKAAAHKRSIERRTILVSICSRMILTPIILVPALAWYAIATRYNVVDDPVFITAAVLLIGSPPALTLAQITSQNASEGGGFERLISRTIFVAYAILAAPTTIALVMTALLIAEKDH